MTEKLEKIEESYSPKTSYWDLSAKANIHLTQMLIDGTTASEKNVVESYQVLWGKAGTLGQKQAELEHFDCLIQAFGTPKTKSEQITNLEKIRAALAAKM
jgi:hypothetical protein